MGDGRITSSKNIANNQSPRDAQIFFFIDSIIARIEYIYVEASLNQEASFFYQLCHITHVFSRF